MTATIETKTKHNVISVPIQSVTTRSPKKDKERKEGEEVDEMAASDSKIKTPKERVKEVVFVLDNNVVKTVVVKRGISNDAFTEIVSGLDENKQVVSGSYKAINRELEDGSKVRIEEAKKKSDSPEKQ